VRRVELMSFLRSVNMREGDNFKRRKKGSLKKSTGKKQKENQPFVEKGKFH